MVGRCLRCDKPSRIRVYYKKGGNMVDRFSVEENGNMVYIAEDYMPVTSCFDSYDRTDLQKIVDMMNNLNQCYFDELKKNGELTKENQALKSAYGEMEDYLARLEEENERLKKLFYEMLIQTNVEIDFKKPTRYSATLIFDAEQYLTVKEIIKDFKR